MESLRIKKVTIHLSATRGPIEVVSRPDDLTPEGGHRMYGLTLRTRGVRRGGDIRAVDIDVFYETATVFLVATCTGCGEEYPIAVGHPAGFQEIGSHGMCGGCEDGDGQVSAQELYDLRELTGFCSGSDLHDLFQRVTDDRDPSPKGAVLLSTERLMEHSLGSEALRRLGSPLRTQLEEIMSYGMRP